MPKSAMSNKEVKNLSFSVFTRYQSVADHINALRQSSEKFSILEVGGRGNFLKLFLPNDKITILDVDDSDEENYVKGDGRKLPFKKHSFDVIVSTDVLEHIPPADRNKYLEEQVRVAREAIILSGPLYTSDVAQIEKKANRYYQELTGEEHPWLKEHVGYGLPEAEKVEAVFNRHKLRFFKSWNQRVSLWSEMVLVDLLVATAYTPAVEKMFRSLSYLYNTKIFPYDCDENGYRTIYTAVLGEREARPLKRKPFSSIDPALIERFQQTVFELLREVQRHHITIIADKDRHIDVLNQTLSDDQVTSVTKRELINERLKKMALKQRIVELEHSVAEQRHLLNLIYGSKRWRISTIAVQALRNAVKPIHLTRRALGILRRDGPSGLRSRFALRLAKTAHYPVSLPDVNKQYGEWIAQHALTSQEHERYLREMTEFRLRPMISIVVPTYKTPVHVLRETVASVIQQVYKDWELVIVDDGSPSPELHSYLKSLSSDGRVVIKLNRKNQGIAGATNDAIKLTSGEYIAFLDHDDELTTDALFHVVKTLNNHPNAKWLYSDEDKIDSAGSRTDPYFKPDFAQHFLMSQMYTCHLSVYEKKFGEQLGWLRSGYDGSQDYDLALRAAEKTTPIHIPNILYHWRKMEGSTAQSQHEKPYAHKASLDAINDALKRRGLGGSAEVGLRAGTFRVRYQTSSQTLVSIIIPTRNQVKLLRSCIESILGKTKHKAFEVLVLDNQSDESAAQSYLKKIAQHPKVTVLPYDQPFNFSAINNFGAKHANGEFLLFLNNDTEVINGEWLSAMLELAQLDDVAAVGAKLLYPNNTIQHAGIILGIGGIAGHSHKYVPDDNPGYFSQKDLIREYSAITAGCLMISKKKFESVSGFDEEFVVAFNDVDLCLRLGKKGYLNLYTPYARLYHHESVSVGRPESGKRDTKKFHREADLIRSRWGELLLNDPYYSPHLSLEREDFSLKI